VKEARAEPGDVGQKAESPTIRESITSLHSNARAITQGKKGAHRFWKKRPIDNEMKAKISQQDERRRDCAPT